jgi:hypothetical protein
VEEELSGLLGAGPMVSDNGRQAFFDLREYARAVCGRSTDAERDAALRPVRVLWGGAFNAPEREAGEGTWRWCGRRGELRLVNPLGRPRPVALRMRYSGWQDMSGPLVVEGDLCGRRELPLTAEPQPLELQFTLPPGEHVLSFCCDGRPMPAVSREIVFRLWDFRLGTDR